MVRKAKLVGVLLITVLLHVLFLSICVASENQPCRPSSCGHIQNISNPFRLKGDPSRCGDPDPAYELVCENNRTILYGKYYVTEINYDNYTIRVVVPGLEKGKCFSTPPYSLTLYDVDQFRPDGHNAIVLMNCTRPVISDRNYIRITPCNTSTNGSSFSSQSYAYALVGDSKQVRDLPYSCTFGITVITDKFQAGSESPISSMSDLQEMLLMGIELSFRRIIWHIDGLQCNLNYRDKTSYCFTKKCEFSFKEQKKSLETELCSSIKLVSSTSMTNYSCLI